MAPKYKLYYFNVRGRGELIRLLFHAAGVQFEDHRVEFTDWPALKPNTPEGTLPYLCIDDKEFGESLPLSRYVARKYNLAGKTDIDQLQADIILNHVDEIRGIVSRARNDKIYTEEQKKELEGRVATSLLPKLLKKIEKRLTENPSGYLIGDSVTIADLAFLDLLDTPLKSSPKLLDTFQKVREHRKKISSLPRLAKYLSTRPDTPI
ncbi:unnamed protein product [Candidula unifasciata]|uniref:Glutathione transferase n=1 Tax=Candidula unifasciata TaxID=100452 RepID=A0A8S3Z0W6_9EUPU|nr:unnamed protein product [Candidula unifasciata]